MGDHPGQSRQHFGQYRQLETGTKSIELAVAAYRDALTVFTRELPARLGVGSEQPRFRTADARPAQRR